MVEPDPPWWNPVGGCVPLISLPGAVVGHRAIGIVGKAARRVGLGDELVARVDRPSGRRRVDLFARPVAPQVVTVAISLQQRAGGVIGSVPSSR